MSHRTLQGAVGLMLALFAMTGPARAEDPPAAAATGNQEALYQAGRTAYEGNDWFAALPPFRNAASAGHVPSMVMMGIILNRAAENGEALIWYHKAARAGSPEGAYWLGTMLANETPEEAKAAANSEGVVHGPEEALKWLTMAAENNHPPAMFALSSVYVQGRLGQQPDPKAALDWLMRAADKQFTPAMKELARAHGQGLLGLTPDPKEAARWEKTVQETEKAAAQSAPKTEKPKKTSGGK